MLMDPSIESLDLSGKGFRKIETIVSTVESQQKILSIKLDNNHVTTLQGIHQYPNLLQVSVRANRVSDISPLGQLTQLVIVNLQNNAITTIQGIDGLDCLQWISLSGNTIKDASGIENCVHLTHLDLSDNFIRILPDLSKLTLLKTLLLHGNGIKTLSSSNPFPTSLHTLTLAENNLTDLNEFSVLNSIKSLRQLSLMGNPCTNETTQDGSLIEYRIFILYWRPSLSVIDGVTTTDIERHQARMLFFGHQQCPFSIGDHDSLIQHLSLSSFNKPFDGHSINNENSSPNVSPSKGPRLFKSTQDPVISTTINRLRYPLSPTRSSVGSSVQTSSIIDTLNSLKEVQQLIKEEEQFLLDQSVATTTTSTIENDDKVGVGNTTITDHSLFVPEARKGFGDTLTTSLERGVVRIGPRLRYSPIPINEVDQEERNITVSDDHEASLASSMTKAYGLPLSDCTVLTQGFKEGDSIPDHTDSIQFHPPEISDPRSHTTDSVQFHQSQVHSQTTDSVQFHSPEVHSHTTDSIQFHPFVEPDPHSCTADSVQFHQSRVHSHTIDPVQFHSSVEPDPHSQISRTPDSVQFHSSDIPDTHSHTTDSIQFHQSRVHSHTTDSVQFQAPAQADHTPKNSPNLLIPPLQLEAINTGISPREVDHTHSTVTNVVQRSDLSIERAAILIQCAWRRYCCKQLLKRHRAAQRIQSTWRGYRCRVYNTKVGEVYKEMRRKKVESYITLLYMQMQGCREELAHQILTVQIQEEALKSLLTEVEEIRNELKKEKEMKRRKAAIVIQKYWRGHLTRKKHSDMSVKKPIKDSTSSALQEQVNSLELAVYNLSNLLVGQIDLPAPVNLRMTHFSSSCLLVQWDPPPDTPLCTHPLINRPDITGYTLYINGDKEGTVAPMKCKAYIEGLDCSITYKIVVIAIYESGRESIHSNPVIAKLSQPPTLPPVLSPDHSLSGRGLIGRVPEYPELPRESSQHADEGNDQPPQQDGVISESLLQATSAGTRNDINTTYDLKDNESSTNDLKESSSLHASPNLHVPPPLTSVRKTTKFFQDPTCLDTTSFNPPSSGNPISTEGVDIHLTSHVTPLETPAAVTKITDTPVTVATSGNIQVTRATSVTNESPNRLASSTSVPSLVEIRSEGSSIVKRHSCGDLYQQSFYKSVSSRHALVLSTAPDQKQHAVATTGAAAASTIYKKSFYNSLEYHALI